MRGQKLVLVKGVYSLEKWTKPNPLMSTENRPVDISSEGAGPHVYRSDGNFLTRTHALTTWGEQVEITMTFLPPLR